MPSAYIPSLDGLRAISILLVLFSHAGVSQKLPGGFGVTIFFFLSGFLITTLLLREHNRTGTISLRNFYVRRVLRLTPPLLLSLLAAAALVLLGVAQGVLDPMTLISQIFFFYNYFSLYGDPQSIEGLGVLWSLSVEEHFYFIWPTLFLFLMRGRLKLGHIVGLIVLFLVWRYIRVLFLHGDEWTIYTSTDTRFDSLLFGCLLAILQTWYPTRLKCAPLPMLAIVALAFAALLVTFVIRDPVFRSTWRYTVQGLALMPIFHFAVTMPQVVIFRPLNWAPLRRIGVWSYTIYLIHFVIIRAFEANGLVPPNRVLFALIVLALSCLWAALVFEIGEKPFHAWRRRLSDNKARVRAASSRPSGPTVT